ncbi:MAG: hypothetical protein SNJ56_03145 [Termitinemataceae bacterium]
MIKKSNPSLPLVTLLGIYTAIFFVLLTVQAIFLPKEALPLPIYRFSWPVIQGLLGLIDWFPALIFSSLLVSFGFFIYDNIQINRFSMAFIDMMKQPILTTIIATGLYAFLLLFAQPVLLDTQFRLRLQGSLFYTAKEKVEREVQQQDWQNAAIHLAICERIWKQSPETQILRDKVIEAQEKERARFEDLKQKKRDSNIAAGFILTREGLIPELTPLKNGLTFQEALNLSKKALERRNPFEAHWYASVAQKLVKPDSPEYSEAVLLATQAWNEIARLSPSPEQKEAFSLFKEKQRGYTALLAKEYIQAYYIFNRLSKVTGDDPDVKKYLQNALVGTKTVAFFEDEVHTRLGETYSMPLVVLQDATGYSILQIESLIGNSDASYGISFKFQQYDSEGAQKLSIQAPYAKMVPFAAEFGDIKNPATVRQTLVLLKAIDRNLSERSWDPVWSPRTAASSNYLVLDIPYDVFLLAVKAQTNKDNLPIIDLFKAQRSLQRYGFIPEVFQVKLMNTLMDPFLCLFLGILVLALGWRFRPHRKPGFSLFFMLPTLPILMYQVLLGSRYIGQLINGNLILALSFSGAILISLLNEIFLLILALLFLAGQRS